MKTSLLKTPFALLLALLMLNACTDRVILPLVGEDKQVLDMLGAQTPDDPNVSALGAARRLHQAMIQKDSDLVWSLLNRVTQRSLDELATRVGTSGRELLESSVLPTIENTLRRVSFEEIFFGKDVMDLQSAPPDEAKPVDTKIIHAISTNKAITELVFHLSDAGWTLVRTTFSE